jgi:regulatory protein
MKQQPSSLTPLDYAYRLLTRRAHSEQELAEKLLGKGFSEAAVARTLAKLKDQGYVNDAQLAADQAERLQVRGFGAAGVRAKLRQKGILEETIDDATTPRGGDEERDAARRFLASRFAADALKKPQTYARAFRLLLRRGFSQEVVESVLGEPPEDARAAERECE